MAKEQTNDELNLRRKARRRLIGAVALTLAVVVILPMVLDSEPKPTGQDIDLRIPAPDKVSEFVPGVAVSEVAEALPMAASAVGASSAVVEPAVAQADKPLVASAVAAPAAASGKEPVAANNLKAEAPKQGQPVANNPPESKKPAESTKAAETKKPEPKVSESKAAETKGGDKRESYVAQVGAYASADTARQEVEKLKKWGFKAYTEKAGNKVRVRVGPYAERDKAEKVRKLLEKHGLHPVITTAK